jgi:type IV secretion system protein VirB4
MIKLDDVKTFRSIIPYSSHVADGVIKTINNDFITSWRLFGIAFECDNVLNLDVFNHQTHTFLKSFSAENVTFYLHVVREKLQDGFDNNSDNYFADKVSELYYQGISKESFMINKIYFTIVFSPNSKVSNAQFKTLNIEDQKKSIESHLKVIHEYSENISSFLRRFNGQKLTTFTTEKGVTFSSQLAFYNFLISGTWQKVPVKSTPIYNTIGSADVYFANENGELHILGKKKFFRSVEIKELPEESNSRILDSVLISDCEFVLTQSFSCLPKRNSLGSIRIAEKRLQASSDDAYKQRGDLLEAKNELVSGDIFFGNYHFSLFIYSDSIDEMIKNSNKILAILSDNGFVPTFSNHSLTAAFCAQLPGVFDLRSRLMLLSSKNFVDFATLHNFETGKREENCWGEAISILKTPNKQPYYLNLHDSNVLKDEFGEKNLANTSVIGTSGSGKTILLSFLLNMFQKYGNEDSFAQGATNKKLTTIFLDKDRGAEVSIRALGGEYYTFKNGVPTGWNPFILEASSENIAFLKSLIRLLCTRSGEVLSARELTAINDSVDSVMSLDKDKRRHGISRCIDNLNKSINKSEKANDLVMRLSQWSKDGEFGWIFDNSTDNFSIAHCSNFGFDGTEFLDNKDICSPISFYILYRVTQLLDGRRVIIFMDEFWKWISDSVFADFAYNKLKTIRKLNGFLVAASQSPDEILKHEISRAVVEICATQIFLANPRANRKDYIEGFKLTPEEYEIIKNLDPNSRQFLIKKTSLQGNSKPFSAVVKLDLKSLGVYTKILSTSTDNLAIFHTIFKEGMKLEEWLDDYLKIAV